MADTKRPILEIQWTKGDWAVEIAGWLVIIYQIVLVGIQYATLPDTIPMHYNAAGVADRYGDRFELLFMPAIAAFLFIGITILNRYPHIFNYPTEITPQNALRQYTLATRMLRFLKLSLGVVFLLIAQSTIQKSTVSNPSLDVWFMPVTLALIFIPLIYFLIHSMHKR